ncbi:MAG: VanZ family protein [Oscillospiraceae bacterium]|nr:VanZ family protein [Oscillospiraceae bacterium]
MDAKGSKWNTVLFGAYCGLMLWLLFARGGPIEGIRWNLTPFRTVTRYVRLLDSARTTLVRLAAVNLFGNVIMFIPLGFFLPRVFGGLRKLWKTLFVTVLIISLVEIAQFFTRMGCCDIDDLILNIIGAAIGYGLYRLRGSK